MKQRTVFFFLFALFIAALAGAQTLQKQVTGLAAEAALYDRQVLEQPSRANEDELDDLLTQFDALKPQEKNEFWRVYRQLNSHTAERKSPEELLAEQAMEEVFRAVERRVNHQYLGDLSEEEMDILLQQAIEELPPEKRGALESKLGYGRSSCTLQTYPNFHAGASANTSTYSVVSVVDMKNEPWEFPCDYEVRFGTRRSLVTGTTFAMNQLIVDFGGSIISRDVSGKDYLLFGFGRTFLSFGLSSKSQLKSHVKIFS